MEDKVISILYGVLGYVLGTTIQSLIFFIYPYFSLQIQLTIVTGSIVALIYGLIQIARKYDKAEALHQWASQLRLSKWGIVVIFGSILGTLIGVLALYHTSLIIDNGSSKEISISIENVGNYTVAPNSFTEVGVPTTVLSVYVDKNKYRLDVSKKEVRWIFNPQRLNTYFIGKVIYGNLNLTETSKDSLANKITLISDELFPTNANYLFEAPEVVLLDQGTKSATQTVLYHFHSPKIPSSNK